MQPLYRLFMMICLFIPLQTFAAQINEKVDKPETVNKSNLIKRVVAAYGGERLTSMKSIKVHDRYKTIAKNGGLRPGIDGISRLHSTLTVDFNQGRKSVKNWNVRTRGKRLGQIMFDGTNGWSINYLRGSHVIRNDLNHNNVGAGMIRLLDTTLIRSLWDHKHTATFDGISTLFGRPHLLLTFKIGGLTKATLYIDKYTHLASQMILANGTRYVYSEHRKSAGVTYASDTNQFRNGEVSMMTLSRTIEVNPDVTNAFDLPSFTKALEGMQDNSKPIVKKLDQDVYISALGNRSSLFVDAGEYFIGIGSLPGFKKRLQKVNDHLNSDKPIKYMVIAEHQGHMGGIAEVAEMNADFLTVANHLPLVQEQFNSPLPDQRFVLVEGQQSIANGKVVVYDIATIDSEQFLLFYVPEAKLVFTMDEFGSNLLNSVPSADLRTLSFRKAIEELGIDVHRFTHVHGTGVLSLEQLRQVTDAYREGVCPKGHSICAD